MRWFGGSDFSGSCICGMYPDTRSDLSPFLQIYFSFALAFVANLLCRIAFQAPDEMKHIEVISTDTFACELLAMLSFEDRACETIAFCYILLFCTVFICSCVVLLIALM